MGCCLVAGRDVDTASAAAAAAASFLGLANDGHQSRLVIFFHCQRLEGLVYVARACILSIDVSVLPACVRIDWTSIPS